MEPASEEQEQSKPVTDSKAVSDKIKGLLRIIERVRGNQPSRFHDETDADLIEDLNHWAREVDDDLELVHRDLRSLLGNVKQMETFDTPSVQLQEVARLQAENDQLRDDLRSLLENVKQMETSNTPSAQLQAEVARLQAENDQLRDEAALRGLSKLSVMELQQRLDRAIAVRDQTQLAYEKLQQDIQELIKDRKATIRDADVSFKKQRVIDVKRAELQELKGKMSSARAAVTRANNDLDRKTAYEQEINAKRLKLQGLLLFDELSDSCSGL